MTVKAIPDGYHSITPYLIVGGAAEAIEFYKQAFGAVEHLRLNSPDGKVAHAEMKIGNSIVMMGESCPEYNTRDPKQLGGTPVGLMIYVEDVDSVFARALSVGGTELRPVQDQFYGDRSGTLTDPFGHQWTISTHKEDLSQEVIVERMKAMYSGQPS